ncbi:MAG: chemotaxis protein CheX [Thermodesulfobacteriota bacterium]|nr:chemotaxis protein CheX [Thermodesulfobacteriota bacterium]
MQKLFSTMLGCEAKHGKPRIASGEGKPGELIAVIELSGPVRGTVAIIFPADTALAIISKMSGIKIPAVDKMVTDGVGEVLNMVAGTAKRRLAKDDFPGKGNSGTGVAVSVHRHRIRSLAGSLTCTRSWQPA